MTVLTEANRQAQATWNNQACGLRSPADLNLLSNGSFYRTISERRYQQDDSWVPAALDFPSMRGKQVLEIGHGMGCDLATAAKHGAIVHGIDLTLNHHEIAKGLFAAERLVGEFHLGNAGKLPFADESMDIVYSIGVLHHTDNARQCVLEAMRVLKPGGTIIVALYNFWSVSHLIYLAYGILDGRLFKFGYRGMISMVEAGANGTDIKPLVQLYSKRSAKRLLRGFVDIDLSTCGISGRRLPHRVREWLQRRYGWYIVARARKKNSQ